MTRAVGTVTVAIAIAAVAIYTTISPPAAAAAVVDVVADVPVTSKGVPLHVFLNVNFFLPSTVQNVPDRHLGPIGRYTNHATDSTEKIHPRLRPRRHLHQITHR